MMWTWQPKRSNPDFHKVHEGHMHEGMGVLPFAHASRATTGDHHARQTTASEARTTRCRLMDKAVERTSSR